MTVRCGDTLLFQTLPVIAAGAAVGGKKESEGPLAAEFDELSADNRFGQSSWEAAEKYLQLRAARLCLQKAALPQEKVQLALAGDLQAQCTASSYAMRELGVPFAGLFGACSTMAEGLALGAALCEGGAARNLLAMASSQPLLRGRAAVPHAAELRRGAHAHGPVDCHRCRMLPFAAAGRRRWHCRCHLWPCAGLSGKGHQQYGGCHGPGSGFHPAALF